MSEAKLCLLAGLFWFRIGYFDEEMKVVIDSFPGTSTSGGEGVEEDTLDIFCTLSLWRVFITVSRIKLWLKLALEFYV